MRPTVTIVGLGPAGPDLCTSGTLGAIAAHEHRFVRTARHPAVSVLGDVVALDHHYVGAGCFDDVYAGIVDEVVAAAVEHGAALYAVPGSPMVAERSVELLLADDRVDTVLVPALSFADLAWVRLGIDPLAEGVRIVDARRFVVEAAGERGPMLVAQVDSPAVLAEMVAAVPDPPPTPVTVLHGLGTADERLVRVAWDDLCDVVEPDHLTSLYIPGLAAPIAVEMQRFVELVATLRLQCPWDAEQTHASLRPHLLEEAYEVIEALDSFDEATGAGSEHLEEELGDLLFQVVFHSRIAADDGRFDLADVARGIHDKLRHRHPHVFPGPDGTATAAADSEAVLTSWDRIKQAEKGRASVLDGIPTALPALAAAQKTVRRAGGVGLSPVDGTVDGPTSNEGLGEALLSLVVWARRHDLDAEDALRGAVVRFAESVRAVEALAAAEGIDLVEADAPTLTGLWQKATGG